MRIVSGLVCLFLPVLVMAMLFSSCSLVQLVNKNLETPTSTVTMTFTSTPSPTDTPFPTPERSDATGTDGGKTVGPSGAPTPEAGKLPLGGEVREVLLWGFNVMDTQNWKGRVSYSSEHPKEGTGCLRINASGMKGLEQDIAYVDPTRLGYYAELHRFRKVAVDVYVPNGALGGNQQVGFDFVTSGPASNWAVHKGYLIAEGWNHLEYDVRGVELKDAWKFLFVIQAKDTMQGSIYIDNIMGKL